MLSVQQVCAQNRCGQVPLNRKRLSRGSPEAFRELWGGNISRSLDTASASDYNMHRLHSNNAAETMCFKGKDGN